MSEDAQIAYASIVELFLLIDDGDRRLLAEFGLTVPRYFALQHIDKHPGLSPVQLSGLMLCDKSNITRLLKGLEKDGLVKRVPHEDDGRSFRLFLSDRGQKLSAAAAKTHQDFNEKRFGFLNKIPWPVLETLQLLRARLAEQLQTAQLPD